MLKMNIAQKNKKRSMGAIFWLVFVALSFCSLQAQSLQDRLDSLRKLQREALQAESEGKYDRAMELAHQIKDKGGDIDAILKVKKRWDLLRSRVSFAKQIHADKYAKEDYDLAYGYYNRGYALMGKQKLDEASIDIEKGIEHADIAIEKSRKLFDEEQKRLQKEKKMKGALVVAAKKDSYEVRLIPARRESLWRIAKYKFIYNDPFLWKKIYTANRDKIKNPNLIYPGQVLSIPPVVVELKKDQGNSKK